MSREKTCPILSRSFTGLLGQALFHHLLLEERKVVDEQDPLQVIEFVLQADCQQAVGIQLLRLSLEILVLE